MIRWLVLVGLLGICGVLAAQPGLAPWQQEALLELSVRYLGSAPAGSMDAQESRQWVDRLARDIGGRLATGGMSAVPAEDVAAFAMLDARLSGSRPASAPAEAETEASAEAEATGVSGGSPGLPGLPGTAGPGGAPAEKRIEDIGKGQEGLRQGIEQLRELPLSERFVVSGDVNAGLQAARVPDTSDMSSAFGRFRLNVTARAVPASPDGRRSEGYFFLQLRAAGGPFDSTPVGHPPAFSPFNGIATDRSLYNEGLAAGNIYLGRAYFQQEYRFGADQNYALLGQVGVVDFSDFFDTNMFANNEVRQFLNSSFVNSAAYKTAIGAPGAVGQMRTNWGNGWIEGTTIRAGYAVARTEKLFQSPIWNAEVELSTRLAGRTGAIRFGGSFGNVADFGSFDTFYTSADHWLTRDFGVFGRFVINSQGAGSQFFGPQRSSVSGGVQRRFVSNEELVSAWGLGFSTAWGIETGDPLSAERVLETYYRWQITKTFALTPDFQLINGAGGVGGTHVVVGLRANFGF